MSANRCGDSTELKATAVARLTGVRIKELPLSAEKLREQLKAPKSE